QTSLAAASAKGITVVAAAGDELATSGIPGAPASVWFPGSSPDVLCCGGTSITLTADRQRIDSEVVWKDQFIGTGGGISAKFSVPSYQRGVRLPPSANRGPPNRGVPD